jgi:SAM-dependent methyltransferase
MNYAAANRAVAASESSTSPLRSRLCPACGLPAESAPLEHARDAALYGCAGCDLHFWHPAKMPDASWYEAMYQGRDNTAMPLEPGHLFFLADPQAPKAGRLLDMGCGVGNFLAAARDAGFDVTGIEPNQNAVRFAKEHYGLRDVFAGVPAELQKSRPHDKFDAVTFFEVLEHQDNPQAFLDTAKSFLKDDGFIALSVPNRNRWQIGNDPLDYPPNHLTRWSPAALRNFLASSGFEVLSIREEPLTVRRAAQMLSTMFRTGLIAGTAGQRPPSFRELEEMPLDELQRTVDRLQADKRQSLAARLSAWKLRALLPLAALLLPYFRWQGRTGLYLYCLARRRSSSPADLAARRDHGVSGGREN